MYYFYNSSINVNYVNYVFINLSAHIILVSRYINTVVEGNPYYSNIIQDLTIIHNHMRMLVI